jgi:aspartate aminotransferase
MPAISKRGIIMPASPIRKLVPYAETAKKQGIKVYHLNIGQPDIETPVSIMNAIRDNDLKILEYSHSAGNESYRRKLTSYYKQVGIEVDYNQIIVTTGGSEAILFGMMACLDPGDEIIIPEPFYANYNGFAVATNISVKPVTANIKNGFALPASEVFEKVITRRTKAILLCNPNNPTGHLYTQEELETLKRLCLKYNLFLFADEAYREFCYSGAHISATSLQDADQHVILMDTISKRYSACGARIGALVTKNQEVLNAVLKFAQARLSPPTIEQIAGEAAVDLPSDYFNNTRTEYLSRRNLLVSLLNKIEGVYCPNPGGAFYAMASLPVEDADKFCQWLLEKFSYKQQTLMLAPGSGFYATIGLGKNEVRLAYVLNKPEIVKAMECLAIALKEYKN